VMCGGQEATRQEEVSTLKIGFYLAYSNPFASITEPEPPQSVRP